MAIINLSIAEIIDPKLFQDYLDKAAVLMHDQGVEVVLRGRYVSSLAGQDLQPQLTVGAVFRYPDLDAAKSFFASEAYRSLIPLRDKACRMTIHLFDEGTGESHSNS